MCGGVCVCVVIYNMSFCVSQKISRGSKYKATLIRTLMKSRFCSVYSACERIIGLNQNMVQVLCIEEHQFYHLLKTFQQQNIFLTIFAALSLLIAIFCFSAYEKHQSQGSSLAGCSAGSVSRVICLQHEATTADAVELTLPFLLISMVPLKAEAQSISIISCLVYH